MPKKSRKYQITINNPIEHGFTHEIINEIMKKFKWEYYCLCDETGTEEKTPHTHLFFYSKNAVLFDTVKSYFPPAHIETCKGSCQENRDYIRKEGKYLNGDKKETNIIETFEEYGELPLDKTSKNETVSEHVLQMIENGYTNAEIIREYPSYQTKIHHLDRTRQTLLEDNHKTEFRKLSVHYIYGVSRTGKTRFVMDTYGYENVYRVSDYKNPFDGYKSQSVLLLDEYNNGISFELLLKLLEGYPLNLPARYCDKLACYTEVYIVSNLPLDKQYEDVQYNNPEQWNALINRISTITRYVFTNGDFQNSDSQVIKIFEEPNDYMIRGGNNV